MGFIFGTCTILALILYNLFNLIFYKRLVAKRLYEDETKVSIFKELNENINERTTIKKKGRMYSLQKKLSQASININAGKFLTNCILICIGCIFLVYFATESIMLCIIVLIIFPLIIKIILGYLKKKKVSVVTEQMLDAINLISSSLKAGYSLIQALNEVAKQSDEPIASEFKQVIEEISVGKSYDEAFNKLMERNPTEELEIVSTAIIINKKFGGNLSYILDVVSETLIGRKKLRREIKTLTAQGRLSGIIVTLLPFAVGGIMCIINPLYITALFNNFIGIIMIGTAVCGQIIGGLVIKSIINNIDW